MEEPFYNIKDSFMVVFFMPHICQEISFTLKKCFYKVRGGALIRRGALINFLGPEGGRLLEGGRLFEGGR